jgi:hypothetical protein
MQIHILCISSGPENVNYEWNYYNYCSGRNNHERVRIRYQISGLLVWILSRIFLQIDNVRMIESIEHPPNRWGLFMPMQVGFSPPPTTPHKKMELKWLTVWISFPTRCLGTPWFAEFEPNFRKSVKKTHDEVILNQFSKGNLSYQVNIVKEQFRKDQLALHFRDQLLINV